MIKVTKNRKRLVGSAILAIVLAVFILAGRNSFFTDAGGNAVILFALSFLLDLAVFGLGVLDFHFSEKISKILSAAAFFICPLLSVLYVECLNSVLAFDFAPAILFGNYVVYLILYGVMYVILGTGKRAIFASNLALIVFGIANHLVETFRGTPLQPMDLVAWKTALNVSSAYTFSLSFNIVVAVMMLMFILAVALRCKTVVLTKKNKLRSRAASAVVLTMLLASFYATDVYADNGIKPDFWNQLRGYRKTGSFANFFMNTKYLIVKAPKGYSSEHVSSLAVALAENPTTETRVSSEGATYSEEVDETSNTAKNSNSLLLGYNTVGITADDLNQNSAVLEEGQTPNIVVIMNETLSDLSVVGDFETNQDYMPFLRSLKGSENTVTGNLYMSVTGAGTCNSEFEFLTGNDMAFLPSGSTSYSLYVKDTMPSLVSTLEDQGYATEALHTYYGNGWNREDVYSYFGFDNFISLEDFIPAEKLEEYKQNESQELLERLYREYFPDQDNALLRKYASDELDYSMLKNMFEEKDAEKPYFVFNVTMQNHGGYSKTYNNFYQSIWLTGDKQGKYPKVNQYLSLMKRSDDAFANLLQYFSESTEPTIVLMFGDHQPSVESEFYEEVLGKSLNDLTTEEDEKRYVTPFVIWANYDIDEGYYEKISNNYLSCLLSEVAGVKQTAYNEYLSNLYETLPVINSVGYCDSEGTWYSWNEESPYSDILSEYEKIQYNYIFDKENKEYSLFYVEDSETAAELIADQEKEQASDTAATGLTSEESE